jgi:KUP system potassium uptake protein
LYAFKEAFAAPHGLGAGPQEVLATLSMLFWAVTLIVSCKYVGLILRLDNDGEGGVLALTALVHRLTRGTARRAAAVVGAGIFAAALFYGDAIITPAISVLSAVEGLAVATPELQHWIIPLTAAILVSLFAIQRHGTGQVGRLFGPVTVLWFLTIGALGAHSIILTPTVLAALDPTLAASFALAQPHQTFLLLSAVFLALTGGEALYADMGHFGARPVRIAWYGLVLPALMLNYFGQGALVLRDPGAVANPFYLLAPDWLLLPLVGLATAATVIASQATISGAFSMTLQAARLGYLPRVRILHTSDSERGQIYIPAVNWAMLAAVLLLVLEFRSSGALAAAYGIAVSGTMIITTVLTFFLSARSTPRRRRALRAALAVFLLAETVFLASNLTKIAAGGWMPLALGLGLFLLLTTWKEGSAAMASQRRRIEIPVQDFVAAPAPDAPRVAGTAVYLTSDPDLVPSALFHNLKHYKVMHERTVFLNVLTADLPRVAETERLRITSLAPGIQLVSVTFGFREEPDVPAALATPQAADLGLDPHATTYFVARTTVVDGPGNMPRWRANLFGWMTRQAATAPTYFNLPANQVVELGTQVLL